MTGLIERILRQRYGAPREARGEQFVEYRWNEDTEPLRCVLYKSEKLHEGNCSWPSALPLIYADTIGCSILRGAVRLAMLHGPKVFGLYQIEELQSHPEVLKAKAMDSQIEFFMDASNVWYYGVKGEDLFVYDAPMEELDNLGSLEPAIVELIQRWEDASSGIQ